MALLGALCIGLNALGFTNRSLRAQVSRLLGAAYTASQMSYDLSRLRLNGLIERIGDTNTYLLTSDGQRVAMFYTKVHNRLLRPLLAASNPPAPVELAHAPRAPSTGTSAATSTMPPGSAAEPIVDSAR